MVLVNAAPAADGEALYAAKANGRDRSVHYSELERKAIRADQDIDLYAFENVTRVIAERVSSPNACSTSRTSSSSGSSSRSGSSGHRRRRHG